ncbi:MAG: aminotransferase class I/II-fold pyridoxal phosphate-dependent enzyme [Planctomycetota bacterium]
MRSQSSAKAARFSESVIREMTRICTREGGVNLAQGFPDFAAPLAMKEAAKRAIDADVNQYAVTWGAPALRAAIARRMAAYNGLTVDPEREITVTCGATEAMIAALLATLDPLDEAVVFTPFYENYGPDCVLAGAVPRFVALRPPHWTFDPAELAAACGPRTRAILVNTPHNPTGKVFSRAELQTIADLCQERDLVAVTDEIYEYILYDGHAHVSLATLPGMRERTITISGLSKTWSATGWRIGWAVASAERTSALKKVHDFLTVGAPAPLQEAAAEALDFGPDYFRTLAADYTRRRDRLVEGLRALGFAVHRPAGAYYVMAGFERFARRGESDVDFARRLVVNGGVAVVPGSSFYPSGGGGSDLIRFCFAKRDETLTRALDVLATRLR